MPMLMVHGSMMVIGGFATCFGLKPTARRAHDSVVEMPVDQVVECSTWI